MHHPTDRITHTTAFVTPVVEHWLEREIAQWVHSLKCSNKNTAVNILEGLTIGYEVTTGRKEMFLFNDTLNTFYLHFILTVSTMI